MFGIFLKFSLSFITSFIILSFNISGKSLFHHISSFTGPLGENIQASIASSFSHSFEKSKKISNEMLSKRTKKVQDEIKSKRSALKEEKILEEIKKDEIKKLDEIIKNN